MITVKALPNTESKIHKDFKSVKNELKKPSIGYAENKSLYNDIKKNIQGIENKKKIPKKTIKQLFKIN